MIKILPKLDFIHRKTPSKLVMPIFEKVTKDGCSVHTDIPISYKGGSHATLSTNIYEDNNNLLHTICSEILNSCGEKMGTYTYDIDTYRKSIKNGIIVTEPGFQHKGIGEILRLSSIMELNENNIKALSLESVSSAIPFHFKYKFKPCLKDKKRALDILLNIVHKSAIDKKYKTEAQKLVEEISYKNDSKKLKYAQAKHVNNFISRYIEEYTYNWNYAKFPRSIPMVLTKKDIKHFASFYNELFKKHGIDYTV